MWKRAPWKRRVSGRGRAGGLGIRGKRRVSGRGRAGGLGARGVVHRKVELQSTMTHGAAALATCAGGATALLVLQSTAAGRPEIFLLVGQSSTEERVHV